MDNELMPAVEIVAQAIREEADGDGASMLTIGVMAVASVAGLLVRRGDYSPKDIRMLVHSATEEALSFWLVHAAKLSSDPHG